jgi:DNA polymerase-3 subunit gamma/tau
MGKKVSKLVDIPVHEIDLMRDQVKNVSLAFLNQIFDLLLLEETTIRQSSQPKLAVEMVFIRLLQIKPALPIDILIEKLDNLRKDIYETQKNDHNTTAKPVADSDRTDSQGSLSEVTGTAESTAPFEAASFEINGDLSETWQKLFITFSEKHPSLAPNLKDSILKKLTDRSLEIEVSGNGFNINMIRRTKNMDIIKKVCHDFFGKEMDVRITLKKAPNDESRQEKGLTERLKKEALNHPLVDDAVEIFDGKVVDVKILP